MRMCEWSAFAHMSSVMVPVNVRRGGAAESVATARRIRSRGFMEILEMRLNRDRNEGGCRAALRFFRARSGSKLLQDVYSPGVIRWAVDVPAFMIHTPPDFGLSGS